MRPLKQTHSQRRQQEEQQLRWISLGISLVLLAALSLLFYAALTVYWLPQQQAMLTLTWDDGTTTAIIRRDFFQRVRFERARYLKLADQDPEAYALLQSPQEFGQVILEQMALEQQIHAEAARRGLTVNPAEIEHYIAQSYENSVPTDTAGDGLTPDPWAWKADYAGDLEAWNAYGIDQRAFEKIVESQLLKNRLAAELGTPEFEIWLETQRTQWIWGPAWTENIPTTP